MESYQFEFCGRCYELRSELPLEVGEEAALFRCEKRKPDLILTCSPAEELSPGGTLLGRTGDKAACRLGDTVERCSMTGRQTYAILSYRSGCPRQAELRIRRKEWKDVSRGLQLWIAAEFPQLLLHLGSIMLHASYIDCGGRGLLFTAPSQTGKSTQAQLWRTYRGAEVINGDKAGISPSVPPVVHSLPFSGTSGICKNRSLPLEAVVVLSQAPENSVRRLSVAQAVTALSENIFCDQLVPEEWSAALNLLIDLAARVPVYALACTPDERAVETLEQVLNSDKKRPN